MNEFFFHFFVVRKFSLFVNERFLNSIIFDDFFLVSGKIFCLKLNSFSSSCISSTSSDCVLIIDASAGKSFIISLNLLTKIFFCFFFLRNKNKKKQFYTFLFFLV